MSLTCELEKFPDSLSRQVRKARRFSLDPAPLPNAPLVVISGGRELCSPQYTVECETFDYYSVELVVRGRGWLTLDSAGHALSAGSVFCYGPGVRQRVRSDPRELLDKYFIHFTGPRALSLLRDCGL